VITGISGGEFGVRGFVAAYDIKSGSRCESLQHRARRRDAHGSGQDHDLDRRQDGAGRQGLVAEDLQGDQWKIGGGTTWGWYSYDPKLNLMYYGSGNPSTWNPVQRPGDNRSGRLTIWAA